jgi:hypothetical protein
VNADTYPRANWRVSLGAFGTRIGEGNDLRKFVLHVDDPNPPFPSGVIDKSIGVRVGTRWELPGNKWIEADYAHVKADDRGHVAGADDSSDGFRLEIRWEIP